MGVSGKGEDGVNWDSEGRGDKGYVCVWDVSQERWEGYFDWDVGGGGM